MVCEKYATTLLLKSHLSKFIETKGCHGIHLESHQLAMIGKNNYSPKYLVSASCHTQEDLAKAERLNLNFVTLSPVLPTTSHPDAAALGWKKVASWANNCEIPAYALGGISNNLEDIAKHHGVYGIAYISAGWKKQ